MDVVTAMSATAVDPADAIVQVDAGGQQAEAEDQPADRVGQILRQRDAEAERDLGAGRVEVGDLDVQQDEQQDDRAGRQQRRRARHRRAIRSSVSDSHQAARNIATPQVRYV